MSFPTIVNTGVELSPAGIRIDGRPRILLCASLFYFRLPVEQWRTRLEQVRASGYSCVDVYLPWNFHETAPGRWSFEGRRDIAAFLDLAGEIGLYVIARPGPYICSEWDGGALPAWLGLDPRLRVRQHEPRYLRQVAGWFDRILPILARRQHTAGGPVIFVQLENELDFFDCEDRTGYLTALRDQALQHGINVPLIACAGQGDIPAATANVAGIAAACNFYPDDDSPHIEAEVRRYAALAAPLLITETNRRHRTLRRMLASGAALLAPYLQASGWNFGYTPSVGNWGNPGNFMSHGYDFGGYVSSTGVARSEYVQAQLLARTIDVLGSSLALATPAEPRVEVTTDFPTSSSFSALDLDGGGQLLAVPNLGKEPGEAVVGGTPVTVAADSCPLMLVDFPLERWGFPGTLTLASADLVAAADGVLTFSSTVPATVVLDSTRVELPAVVGGLTLAVETPPVTAHQEAPAATVRAVRRRSATAPEKPAGDHESPPSLESLGVYRGRGTYRTTADLTGVGELLLVGAADILDLSIAGQVRPTITGFGATQRIDVSEVAASAEIEATVEIWGHANFDDARLPALKLGALRGLGTVWAVRSVEDVSALWLVDGHWAGVPAPTRVLGGWSSTRVGWPVTYVRDLRSAGASALHLPGVVEPVRVTIDGGEPVTVHAENPWVMLPAGSHRIAVTMPHNPSGGGIRAELLTLAAISGWSCTTQDDDLMTAFAAAAVPAASIELPLTLNAGEHAWLEVDLPASDVLLRLDGRQLRVTGWASGECLGRIWVGDRPAFSGGDPDSLWVPAGWSGLTLLVQGIAGPGEPELRTLSLHSPT